MDVLAVVWLPDMLFSKNRLTDGGVLQYYIGRAFRIVPLAYVWLFAIYLCNRLILKAIPTPDWHWLISVFFLNFIIPTSDYHSWNGMYLYGSLSSFVFFYALAPFIMRRTKSFSDSKRLLLLATVIYILNSTVIGVLLQTLIGGSAHILRAMGVLSSTWFIVLGIFSYFAFTENKLCKVLMFFVPLYLVLQRYSFVDEVLKGCSIGVFLTVVLSTLLMLSEGEWFPTLKINYFSYLERYSFPLFLGHILVFELVEHYADLMGWSMMKTAVCSATGSCAVAVVLYHGVCVPAKLLEKRIFNKIKQ